MSLKTSSTSRIAQTSYQIKETLQSKRMSQDTLHALWPIRMIPEDIVSHYENRLTPRNRVSGKIPQLGLVAPQPVINPNDPGPTRVVPTVQIPKHTQQPKKSNSGPPGTHGKSRSPVPTSPTSHSQSPRRSQRTRTSSTSSRLSSYTNLA